MGTLGREGKFLCCLWMKQHLIMLIVIVIMIAGSARGQSKEGCPGNCGNLTIPYPFGTREGCYHDPSFLITCNGSDTPFLRRSNIKVLEISLLGELTVELHRSYDCYDNQTKSIDSSYRKVSITNFTLSSKRNKFTAVGCDSYAYLRGGLMDTRYSTGCMSLCDSLEDTLSSVDGSCSGIGCCQTYIPRGVKRLNVEAYSFYNHSYVYNFNPCSYAFVVVDGHFNFSTLDLKDLRNVTTFPVVLDWSIGNKTCEEVGNTSTCGENSDCFNSDNGPGYTCKCRNGYKGNPYLPNGCRDVDECRDGTHNCAKPEFCQNTNGSFTCHCPKGFRGDAKKACTRKMQAWMILLPGTNIGVLVFLLALCCLIQKYKQRKQNKLKKKYFEQNGGTILRERLLGTQLSSRIFTSEELKNATNDYNKSRILGEGGQGTVYKGILPDNQEVAIKKARIGDGSQVEQFINEVIVLSQINHRNVVKLLGCCLETEVPLLIYEFVTNGTLFDHLHSSRFGSFLPWETRLKIAVEIAGTLSYLHSSASVPIIHRDVKSANILLDDKFTAKVSDFGASRLIPADQEQVATLVQGTLGYLDPEYFHTSMLNEKSDVYSFGVVLMELLSGQKALSFNRTENERHLVAYFASALIENRLDDVIDKQVANAENYKQFDEVGQLAVRSTRIKGEERPTMKEVALELEGLRVVTKHKWSDPHLEEVECLLGDHIVYVEGENSNSGNVSSYDSVKNLAGFHIEAGR